MLRCIQKDEYGKQTRSYGSGPLTGGLRFLSSSLHTLALILEWPITGLIYAKPERVTICAVGLKVSVNSDKVLPKAYKILENEILHTQNVIAQCEE